MQYQPCSRVARKGRATVEWLSGATTGASVPSTIDGSISRIIRRSSSMPMWTRTRCCSSSTGERVVSETGRSYGRDEVAKCDVARAGGDGGGTDVDVVVVDGRRITTSLMRSNRDTSSSNSTICRAVSNTPPPCIARFRARARAVSRPGASRRYY